MSLKHWKKRLLFLSLFIFIIDYHLFKYDYYPSYELLMDDDAFASYKDGKIYIGNKKFLRSLSVNDHDILIEDRRYLRDPNMKVYHSYQIIDGNVQNDILEVLCRYNEIFPSDWDRSIDSMRVEWFFHNLSYYCHYPLLKRWSV